jgi:hypothetical protein
MLSFDGLIDPRPTWWRRCTSVQCVQQRLIRENLFVDLVGVSGKKLLSQRDLGRRGTTKGAALLRHFIDSI